MQDDVADGWDSEVKGVINDIKDHVRDIQVSERLNSNQKIIYLNLTTLENNNYCIELTGSGFRIVGLNFDTKDIENGEYFETPYSLLNSVSPGFGNSFSNSLFEKLSALDEK